MGPISKNINLFSSTGCASLIAGRLTFSNLSPNPIPGLIHDHNFLPESVRQALDGFQWSLVVSSKDLPD